MGRAAAALVVVFALQAPPPSAWARESVSSSSFFGRLARSEHLLFGVEAERDALKEAGLDLSLFYNAFTGFRLAGGDGGKHVEQSGSADFFAIADLDRLGLRGAGTLLLQVKALHDRNVNPSIGALSDPIDDADGDDFYLDQLWFEQPFFDHRLHWRIGYLDQQVLVDRNAYANSEDRQFFATALDNNNLIVPVGVGLGTALSFEPVWWFRFVYTMSDTQGRAARAGWDTAFDGFDAHFHVAEVTIVSRLPGRRGPLGGSYRIGGIFDPRPRRKFGAPPAPAAAEVEADYGFYLSVDQQVFAEEADAKQGLGLFARYGHRDGSANSVSHFWSFGAEYAGPFPGRDGDAFGLGFYGAHGSDRRRETVDPEFDAEFGAEAYLRFEVAPWLDVTPDLQALHNPGGRRSEQDALVAALRVRITF